MKPLEFLGSSQDDLRNFPAEARRDAGFEIFAVQQGLMPSDWKPMPEVGSGAMDIRIRVLGEWRVIYVAKFADFSTSCMLSRKRPRRLAKKILNSLTSAIALLEANDENSIDQIQRQRFHRSGV